MQDKTGTTRISEVGEFLYGSSENRRQMPGNKRMNVTGNTKFSGYLQTYEYY